MDVSSDDYSFNEQPIPDDLNVTGQKYLMQLDDSELPPQPPEPPPRKEGNYSTIKVDLNLECGKRYTMSELEERYRDYKFFKILKLFANDHGLTYMRYFTLDVNMIGHGYRPIWRTEYCNIYCKAKMSHAFVPKQNSHGCEPIGSYSLGDDSSCTLS